MAKTNAKNTEAQGATTEEQPATQALATTRQVSEALQTATGFDAADRRGKENLDNDDVVLPFLAICQKTSPQLESDSPKYIDGIRFLEMFNSLTGDRYGQGPIAFIPILCKKHAIEFNPYESGGGIKDRNVPWDDERCKFQDDEKPVATRFYDWIVWLVETGEPIVLSFKGTGISVAKQFQQILNLRTGPAFTGKYTVATAKGTSNGNTFGKFVVKPAGKTPDELIPVVEEIFENLKGKNIVLDHEGNAENEGEGRQPGDDVVEQGTGQPANTGKVPF
jgi:hypothetical protein